MSVGTPEIVADVMERVNARMVRPSSSGREAIVAITYSGGTRI